MLLNDMDHPHFSRLSLRLHNVDGRGDHIGDVQFFFVQLELKGLSRFGDDVNQFFTRSISGFRGPQEVFGSNPYEQ